LGGADTGDSNMSVEQVLNASVVNRVKSIPFTAFIDLATASGNRAEVTANVRKLAARMENELETICGSSEYVAFDFVRPISHTPGFGSKPARITIHGHACPQNSFTSAPVGQQTYDYHGVSTTGVGSGNPTNRIPSDELNDLCISLKASIESALSAIDMTPTESNPTYPTISRLELAGYIFGTPKGTTFPTV